MVAKTFYSGQVLWSQIDANRHLRHSAYADFCAQARSNMLQSLGLSLDIFAQKKIGPILFREEIIYHREILLDETIRVEVELTKLNLNNGRFSFRHTVYKEDDTLSATVHVDGAWMNLSTRKLTDIPKEWYEALGRIPKAKEYNEVTH